MKTIILAVLLLSVFSGYSQTDIQDLINANDAKNFLYLRYDPSLKKLFYQMDKIESKHSETTLEKTTTVTIPKKRKELPVELAFLNPLKYSYQLFDTLYADPQSLLLGKASDDAKNLLNILGANSAASSSGNEQKLAGANIGVELTSAFQSITSKDLIEWKLFSLDNDRWNCKEGFSKLILNLAKIDISFFDGGFENNNSLVSTVKEQIDKLGKPTTLASFITAKDDNFVPFLATTNQRIKDNTLSLTKFKGLVEGFDFSDKNSPACDAYLKYSKEKFMAFISSCEEIDKKRAELQQTLGELLSRIETLISDADLATNSIIIKRVTIDGKSIREVGITLVKINNDFTSGKFVQKQDEVLSKSVIKFRTYRSPVLEYSAGVFYTNLTYPKYGTRENAGITTVEKAGDDHYRTVAANFLNLIFNKWQGDVQPLLQLGVGTGKDLPSVLFGTGLRFFEPVNFAFTGGCIWTWRKDLDKLQEGSVIKGSADLENDLKYSFNYVPRLYLGIQYNF